MKILRLDLLAFGPFTGLSLDLSAGAEGLHVIAGPNEAGKSSALRALRDLFFGIAERTDDNFLHPYDKLCLGASIRRSSGEVLEFLRRKARKHPLREPDDETPIEPARLDRFLGGVDAETFQTLFGIDHAGLRRGGRTILEGKGQVGAVLFAAGAGLTGLRGAASEIQDELDELFKPRGQNPKINRLIREIDALREQIRSHQLPSEEWVRHDESLRKAREQKEQHDRTWQETNRERGRLSRIRDALKPIARREELRSQLEGYRDVVPLPADFGERHRAVREARTGFAARAEQAEADLQGSEAQLAQIVLPEDVLAEAEGIEGLHQRLGAYRKAQKDRPGLLGMLHSDEHAARDLLEELGRPRDLDAAGGLRLRADEPEAIRELGRLRSALDATRDGLRETIAAHDRRLGAQTCELEAIGPTRDVEPLRRAVARGRKFGDPEAALAKARAGRQRQEHDARRELEQLPHWSGSLDGLERLAVPLPETTEPAERQLDAFRQQIAQDDRDQPTIILAIGDLNAAIRALELERDVPTEGDLRAARLRRDEGWRLVRHAWLEPTGPEGEGAVSFVADFAPGRHLADAFEQSLGRADELADRLRREADRVAALAEKLAERERLQLRLDALRAGRQATEARLAAARGAWEDRLRASGLPPIGPEELRPWLLRRGALVERAQALRHQGDEIDRDVQTIAAHRDGLAAALRDAGEPEGAVAEPLADRLDRAEAAVAAVDTRRVTRDQLRKAIEDERREREEAHRRLGETDRQLAEWRDNWSARMARLGLDADATPAQADAFLQRIVKLFQALGKARGFRVRIEGIDRDTAEYTAEVAATAGRVAPVLAERPVEEVATELYHRLGAARELRKGRDALAASRDEAKRKLRDATEAIADARARLDELCREARCAAPDDLPRAERDASKLAELEAELARVEDQVRDSSGGASLDAFVAEARAEDADSLGPLLEALDEQLEAIAADRSELDQEIGAEREWLRSQKGSAEAAEAAEHAQSLLAELRSKVDDYAALTFASELLRRGIEQFREANQGPVLRRAGELFATLTAGSFQGLCIDEGADGQAMFFGVREGRSIDVAAMSDGSCDQLYLALRLASLEGWLARHEPIPLIADDILLNFDNERSVAALRALAELSRHTQVLFFTHHEHLVDLARDHLPADVLFIHRLAASPRAVPAP